MLKLPSLIYGSSPLLRFPEPFLTHSASLPSPHSLRSFECHDHSGGLVYLATDVSTGNRSGYRCVLGGLVQFLFQIPFLIKAGVMVKPKWGGDPGVVKIRTLMIPTLFGVSVSQINLLFDTFYCQLSTNWLNQLVVLFRSFVGVPAGAVWYCDCDGDFACAVS